MSVTDGINRSNTDPFGTRGVNSSAFPDLGTKSPHSRTLAQQTNPTNSGNGKPTQFSLKELLHLAEEPNSPRLEPIAREKLAKVMNQPFSQYLTHLEKGEKIKEGLAPPQFGTATGRSHIQELRAFFESPGNGLSKDATVKQVVQKLLEKEEQMGTGQQSGFPSMMNFLRKALNDAVRVEREGREVPRRQPTPPIA